MKKKFLKIKQKIKQELRILERKVYISFYKKTNGDFKPVNSTERKIIKIVGKTLSDSETVIQYNKDNGKYYAKQKSAEMLIILDCNEKEITIINHIYEYNIKLSFRVSGFLYTMFNKETSKRCSDTETEYRKNIKNSLDSIISRINN